jgi:4-hydroxythreonine-4-phosphate dehydrogenase
MTQARLAITPGEPAGIGPDLLIEAIGHHWPLELVALADSSLLRERARLLDRPIEIRKFDPDAPAQPHQPGVIRLVDIPTAEPVVPGQLNAANAGYVMTTLEQAAAGCLRGTFAGLVTAPVQKSVINEAGIAFTGHTEFLAERAGNAKVVMMLASKQLRVALVTTHLPLRSVADAIHTKEVIEVLQILHTALQQQFGIANPTILVCGLNPHAGENGYLGREELDIIEPALAHCRQHGMQIEGPLPADSLFTPEILKRGDAVLAMYHDQGLGPFKALSFGEAVNVTLGLPFVRTSVDHGTALALAGTGKASPSSLHAAINLATQLCSPDHG